jgi:predicted AAA+ superfamily ATPase
MALPRLEIHQHIATALTRSRIVALLGPRQCGKTTLARQFLPPDHPAYFDLEDPVSAARLSEPMTALGHLEGLVVIDEIQRAPHLFQVLRVLADREPLPARFLILGSASPDVIKGASESLAGRVELIPMGGFHLPEVGSANLAAHWLRGGFPLSYLAASDEDSFVWRKNFTRTFLERDLPALAPSIKIALADLELDRVAIVYPGNRAYALSEQVWACPLTSLGTYLSPTPGSWPRPWPPRVPGP